MALHPAAHNDEDAEATPLSEINVTPLVDVMLVLLIVFMVAAPLMMAGVPLQLPKTTAARLAQPHQPIILSLNRDGHIFVGSDPIPDDGLPTRLHDLIKANPDQIVYLRADRALPYGQVMQIMGTLATAGFSRISLLTEQAPPVAPP